MSNSHGNTNRDVRRWLRKLGVRANAANVELIGREVRRSESQNDAVQRVSREAARARGESGTYDRHGRDVHKVVRERVRREVERRERGRGR